jgi:exonuclease III
VSKLTASERNWIKKVQRVLNEQPSSRIAFFTIGDNNIIAYNHDMHDEITNYQDTGSHDFCTAVRELDLGFDDCLFFKNPVESTAG